MNVFQTNAEEPDCVHASAINWSLDGVKLPDDNGDVSTEYLFDRGATVAVRNNRAISLNYRKLLSPIAAYTTTDNSNDFIVGKGNVQLTDNNGEPTKLTNFFYFPTATSTIISPGALIAGGAKVIMTDNKDMKLQLVNGKTITARH